ncbi:MAG TPA: hypothetical protein VMD30_04195 [Tepidisphaeraceae bacterium]|nr:hypothetical protein [Tepidisphaeraceae bacterium]
MPPKELDAAEKYFADMIPSLFRIACDGSPWVFLCGTALIEYLSKLAYGQDGGRYFIQFVKDFMSPRYRNFCFDSGSKDLPEQMYYVLRCGVVHSFSLFPNEQGANKGGRERSIGLSHDTAEGHIKMVKKTPNAPDTCCLNAFEFVADIAASMRELFERAKFDPTLAQNITIWVSAHPPIAADSPRKPSERRDGPQ